MSMGRDLHARIISVRGFIFDGWCSSIAPQAAENGAQREPVTSASPISHRPSRKRRGEQKPLRERGGGVLAKRARGLLVLLLHCFGCIAAIPAASAAENTLYPIIANALARPEGARLVPYQWPQEPDIIALYFGAIWCGPCHAFTPQLREVHTRLRDAGANTEVVYVSLDTSDSGMRRHLRQAQMPWPAISPRHLRTLPAIAALAGPAPPNLVLIDRTGQVLANGWEGRHYHGLQPVLQTWIEAFAGERAD